MAWCDGITMKGRFCKRPPTLAYELKDGDVKQYCTQHAKGEGVMKLLLPYSWEIASEVKLGHDPEVGRALRGGRR